MAILNKDTSIGDIADVYERLSMMGPGGDAYAELLGTTPYTTNSDYSIIKLTNKSETPSQPISYSISSVTVGDLDNISNSSGLELSQEDGLYKITQTGAAGSWFSKHITITLENLTIGDQYTLYVDGRGCTYNPPSSTIGHYTVFNDSFNEITSLVSPGEILNDVTFSPTTATTYIRIYAGDLSTYSAETVAYFKDLYINKANTNNQHGAVYSKSGEFTGSIEIENVPSNVVITCSSECDIYAKEAEKNDRFKGKKMVCFGDSITGNTLEPDDYPSIIAKEMGMTVYNVGFGGCRMASHPAAEYNAFSMYKLADAIAANSFSEQTGTGAAASIPNKDKRLETLMNIDWDTIDFISIFYGTNDIAGDVPIDNNSNKLDTYYFGGALRYSIEKILTKYPHIKILLLTPIYRYFDGEGIDSDEKKFSSDEGSTRNANFTDWGDKLKEIAEEYKLPYIDMYRTLGINKINRLHYFNANDGTHPNSVGQLLIGNKIAGNLAVSY